MKLQLRTWPTTKGSRLASVTASQPAEVVTADQLGAPFNKTGDWIRSRTGIDSLRRLRQGDDLLNFAIEAANKALAQAALTASEIDLTIIATCSLNTKPTVSFGDRVVAELGIRSAVMDVNAACAGFTYALSIADSLIRMGANRNVLVVTAEHMSALLDSEDLGTSILFGDGAAAAVVAAHHAAEIGPVVYGSNGAKADLIRVDDTGYLRMSGQEVFRWAVDNVPQLARTACDRAGVTIDSIDVFVPHQANLRITEAVVQRLGLRRDAIIARDSTTSGNTSASSIPIALANLRARGESFSGAVALLVAFGAGMTYAAQVVQLP